MLIMVILLIWAHKLIWAHNKGPNLAPVDSFKSVVVRRNPWHRLSGSASAAASATSRLARAPGPAGLAGVAIRAPSHWQSESVSAQQ